MGCDIRQIHHPSNLAGHGPVGPQMTPVQFSLGKIQGLLQCYEHNRIMLTDTQHVACCQLSTHIKPHTKLKQWFRPLTDYSYPFAFTLYYHNVPNHSISVARN